MRLLFLNSDQNNEYRQKNNKIGGVGYYRMWLPKLALEELGWKVDMVSSEIEQMIDTTSQETTARSYVNLFNKYDAVMIKHFDNPNAGRFLTFASEFTNTPLIADIDDYVLGVRDDQPASKQGYKKGEVKRTTVGTMLSFASAFFVTNEFLGKKLQEDMKTIFDIDIDYYILPNYCNPEEWKYPTKTNKDKVVIGWHGSLTHDSDLSMILPTIKKIMEENSNVYLELMGGVNKDFAIKHFKDWLPLIDRIELIAGTRAWHNFPYHLCKQRWDIGIAPLIDDEFNKSKSNIKWLEYSLKGIPTVASNIEPYHTIKHGINGYLCNTTDEWYETLTMLINNPKQRQKVADKASKEVRTKWDYRGKGKMWKRAFNSVLKSNKKD